MSSINQASASGYFDPFVRSNTTAMMGPSHRIYCGENTLLATSSMKISVTHTISDPSGDHVSFTNPRSAHATANTRVASMSTLVTMIAASTPGPVIS